MVGDYFEKIFYVVKKIFPEAEKVEIGKRENLKFIDVFVKRSLKKEDWKIIERKFEKEFGEFLKIITTSSSFSKKLEKQTQRIWFCVFKSKEELENFVKEFEEKKKRDHRFIGEHLDLFHFEEEIVGSGLPIFHPKGQIIRIELIKLIREINEKLEFKEVWAPHLSKTILWKISGHYEKYKEKMFIWETNEEEFGLKPMNCPLHIQIYKFKPRSYRDLPIKISEFATVYRKEQSGELYGLARVWSITQDDHHLFLRPDQIETEVKKIIDAVVNVYRIFNFEFEIELSTKPESYIGSDEIWEIAESQLKKVLEDSKVKYKIREGEGAFYGPKIDFKIKDSMGRFWQLATIQLDFNMPERFNLTYIDRDGKERKPVIIHLAILGSLERFIALLLEHFKGRLPLWISPIQVRILPVSEKFIEAAVRLENKLKENKIRVDLDTEGTLEKRIRKAELEKIPCIITIGKREIEEGTLAIRIKGKVLKMNEKEFIDMIKTKIARRSLE